MLALKKAVRKNLEEPLRKRATLAIHGMRELPTYASVVAPLENTAI